MGAKQVPCRGLDLPRLPSSAGKEGHSRPSPSWRGLGRSGPLQTCGLAHLQCPPVPMDRECHGSWGGRRHSRNARGRPSSTGQLSVALMLLTPPPCLRFLPSRAPSLAASLLPVVYFLFCYPAEEVGGEYPWSRSPRILCLQDLEGGERGSPGEIPLRCTAGLIEPGVDLPYL